VVLTTRPRPHLPTDLSIHRVFYLQDIKEKIVDDDIWHYLEHILSQEEVARRLPGLRQLWSASAEEIMWLVGTAGRLFIIAPATVRFILDEVVCDPAFQMKRLRSALDGCDGADGQTVLSLLLSLYNGNDIQATMKRTLMSALILGVLPSGWLL
jgi:hypothetical protein